MYVRVQRAIDVKVANSSAHGIEVSDYLNIYCLGNRETPEGSEASAAPVTHDEKLLARTRRHQVYVHSKMMIVDDAVALIGTANVNQRSMVSPDVTLRFLAARTAALVFANLGRVGARGRAS